MLYANGENTGTSVEFSEEITPESFSISDAAWTLGPVGEYTLMVKVWANTDNNAKASALLAESNEITITLEAEPEPEPEDKKKK